MRTREKAIGAAVITLPTSIHPHSVRLAFAQAIDAYCDARFGEHAGWGAGEVVSAEAKAACPTDCHERHKLVHQLTAMTIERDAAVKRAADANEVADQLAAKLNESSAASGRQADAYDARITAMASERDAARAHRKAAESQLASAQDSAWRAWEGAAREVQQALGVTREQLETVRAVLRLCDDTAADPVDAIVAWREAGKPLLTGEP